MLCRFTMAFWWKTIYQEIKKVKAWDVTVFEAPWQSVITASRLYGIVQVTLVLLTGGAQIMNAQTTWTVTKIVIWLARLCIHWQRVMLFPIVMKVCRNFKESLHFIPENQIFLRNSFLSNTDSHKVNLSIFIRHDKYKVGK